MSIENLQETGLGYGSSNREELNKLFKALQANTTQTNIAQLQGGGALQVQSLESTLVVLTAQENNANFLRLWKNIPKDQAYSTIEEYTTQLGYGMGDFGWSGQLDLPQEADPYLKREYAVVKFIRKVWKVSDIATMVKTINDPEVIAKRSSLLNALRTLNESLYWGDSNLIPEMIDGFEKVITANSTNSSNIIDARNGLQESHFQQLAEIIVSNFGNVEGAGLYVSPAGVSAISNLILPGERFLLNQIGADGKLAIGYGVDRIRTYYGTIIPQMDLSIASIYEGRGVPTIPDPTNPNNRIEGATSTNAPGTPTVTLTTLTGQPNSKWVTGSTLRPAGLAYSYRVAAGNKYGLSQASPVVTSGIVPAGGAVRLTITKAASGEPATFFEIYSEKSPGSGFRLLKRIPASSGPTTTFDDLNDDIPGTTKMFLLDFTSTGEQRACAVKRLAPALSQELAKIGPYRWGFTYLYLTPVYYAPLRFAMIKNVDVAIARASKYYDM
jgi:hypothetical protein